MKYSHLTRIYINEKLREKQPIIVKDEVFHYLKNVLRIRISEKFRLFNANDGEFLATVEIIERDHILVVIDQLIREVNEEQKLILVTSIIKQDRLVELVKAATQLGCSKIIPLISEKTQYHRINKVKLIKSMIQSVAQSERFFIPELAEEMKLVDFCQTFSDKQIIFACESEDEQNKLSNITSITDEPYLLIGPEGGFSAAEINLVKSLPNTQSISLGQNILRSEIAAIALLSYVALTR